MHEMFNARRFEDLRHVIDEDVLMVIEGTSLRGLTTVRDHLAGIVREIPIRVETERVLAECGDTLVSLTAVTRVADASPESEPAISGSSPPLISKYLAVHRIAAGRIVEWRTYLDDEPGGQASRSGPDRLAGIHRLMSEQAALRRVATLVAEGAGSGELFAAVAREVSDVVGIPVVGVARFEADGTFTIMGVAGETSLTVGTRWPVEKEGLVEKILATGRPARKGDYTRMPGPLGDAIRDDMMIATVGVPIVVEGHIWGSMVGAARPGELIPDGAEERLARFTELVATAIANSQSREHLARLADEQTALRRVAELVARGASVQEVFHRVTVETSRLLDDAPTTLLSYERSGAEAVIAALSHPMDISSFAPGAHFPVKGEMALAQLWRSGDAVRTDGCDGIADAQLVPPGIGATVLAPIVVEGRVWGALGVSTHGQAPPSGTEERLAPFCELVAAAIANADYRAKLMASRARVVASADEARRRLARDVHDGAQQRLVHTLITLKRARTALPESDGEAGRLLDESLAQAQSANALLRELAQGIMPAALVHGGLRGGVRSLFDHVTLPADTEVLAERLPVPVETTAYFVIAEALTNVVKHAGADRVRVRALLSGDRLEVEVSNDGKGGADPAGGSGLIGLADRVEAAGGSMSVSSPPGAGTTLTVALPIEQSGLHEEP